MGSDTSEEGKRTILKMIACCERLVDAVEEENKTAAMEALKECAAINIRMLQIMPNADALGAYHIFNVKEIVEFRKKLTSLCG